MSTPGGGTGRNYLDPSVTSSWEWMNLIGNMMADTIESDTDFGRPPIVYGNMNTTVGPKECCEGIVTVEITRNTIVGELWPYPPTSRRPSDGGPCANPDANTVTARYLGCAPAFGDGMTGAAPSIMARNEAAEKYNNAADAVAQASKCVLKGWRKKYGRVRYYGWGAVPRQGQCTGFEVTFNVAVGECCD